MKNSELARSIIKFRKERDWEQFHSLKDLCLGIGIEVAELQEIFLWKTNEEIVQIKKSQKEQISNELADIFIFLTYLSNDLNIDLESAVSKKLALNALKYPVLKSKGKNIKYNKL